LYFTVLLVVEEVIWMIVTLVCQVFTRVPHVGRPTARRCHVPCRLAADFIIAVVRCASKPRSFTKTDSTVHCIPVPLALPRQTKTMMGCVVKLLEV